MSTVAAGRGLRAGFAPALPMYLLLDFARALRVHAPEFDVHVTHLYSVDQLERLRAGELDLAVLVDPQEDPDLEIEPLFPGEEIAACLPSGHRLAGREVVRPDDLREETLVAGVRAMNPAAYERAMARLAAAGYRFRSIEDAEGPTGRDLLYAVASGQGIAFVPVSLAEASETGDDIVFRSIDPPLRMPPAAVAFLAKASPGLRPLFATVRSVARELFESIQVQDEDRPPPRGTLPESGVTARQLDVLRLLAEGRSTAEIANELGLSHTTVRNHIAGLMAALGVHTRLQAVLAAKRAGLLDI